MAQPSPNQASYRGTPYEDEKWEIVGEFKNDNTFTPSEFQVIGGSTIIVDPMFADYGGLPPPAEKRVHMPIGALSTGAKRASAISEAQIQQEDTRVKLENEELEKLLAEAKSEGEMLAFEQAVSRHQEQLERLQTQINAILSDIDKQFKERVVQIENQALDLALNISKHIIDGAVEINPEYILPIISEAIDKVGTATVRSIRVSPEDMEFINIIGIERQLKEFDGSWNFQEDSSVRSGCIVDTSAGEIDYQLDRAWERMRDKILSVKKDNE
jgi:flagellar biosynthesis/type III secretory pathway protein FliH